MKYLLDTHIWLWSLLEPEKLNDSTLNILQNNQHNFYISPISIWETILLAEKGRITLTPTPIKWVKEALKRSPVKEAKLTNSIAVKSRLIKLSHQDPADRFIAATAWEYGYILITKDWELQKANQIEVFRM